MKTNLDKKFKTNVGEETEGIWFEVGEGAAFKLRRYGGANSQALISATAKWKKPFARQIEMKTITPEKSQELNIRVFVDTCLSDWKGIQTEKENAETKEKEMVEIPFSEENALELFRDLPELMDTLFVQCMDSNNYRGALVNS